MEIHRPEQVLQGHPVAPSPEGFPKGCERALLERTVELEVKLHARASELMGDQPLHVAACVRDITLFQPCGSGIDRFEDRLQDGGG